MDASDLEDRTNDARTIRLYYWVIICEAVTVAALWIFRRVFS